MLKAITILEEKINDKVAQLHLDPSFTYGEVHDALHKMLVYIVERITEAAQKASPDAVASQVSPVATVEPAAPKAVVNLEVETQKT